MELLTDVERGQWIVERAGAWATVGGVAGAGFEAYARVLHPIEATRVDLTRSDEWGQHPIEEETTWTWATVAERNGRVMHPLVQWRRLTDDESLMSFPDGWGLSQSREGWLDPRLFAALTEHLAKATTVPDNMVIALWDGWGFDARFSFYMSSDSGEGDDSERSRAWEEQARQEASAAVSAEFLAAVRRGPRLAYPGREFVLMQGSLTELADPAWGERTGIGWMPYRPEPTPQMFWPGDHAWVVASEIDWDSTIVAGSRQLIDDVLADPAFEAYDVGEDDLLTWDGDHVNS